MALKTRKSNQPYDRMVDVWGLGLAAFELSSQRSITWSSIDKDIHDSILGELVWKSWNLSIAPVMCLIKQMLQWKSYKRMSAVDVLSDPGLCDVNAGNLDKKTAEVKRFREL